MVNATSTQLQELYVAYFGRAADPTGLDYWTEKGITTAKFAADMYAQAEFDDAYGSLSTESQVNQIYKNLFDRAADVDGLTYWTQEINLGNLKLAEIANHLIYAAQNNSGSEDDKTALTNRTNAAVAYTAKVKESAASILAYQAESTSPWVSGSNITEAISYLSGIDKDTEYTDAGVAASVSTITTTGTPATAKTISLTTGVDAGASFVGGNGADIFNADLSTSSTNTLNALDQLDGGLGTDTLNAVVAASVTPKKLTSIETVVGTSSGGAVAIDLVNSTDVTSVTSNSSSGGILTFNNIPAGASLGATSQAVGATFNFETTSGTESASLAVDGVTGGSTVLSVDGIETISVTANGSDSAYTLAADAAQGTLTFAGAAASTVLMTDVLAVSNFDASATTGGTTLTLINQSELAATADVTVTGGSGNDSITASAHTQSDLNIVGGAGNDTITNTAIVVADTVDGGDGTDTLSTNNTQANVLDATTTSNITNIETVSISDALDGTLVAASIASSIDTVTLALTGASGVVYTGGDTITGPAGSLTVNIGAKAASNATTATGALTIGDTGSATADSLTINNKAINSTTGANVDTTNGQNITSSGYENVTYNSGSGTGNVENDIGVLTITGDSTSTAQTLTITGTNAVDIDTSLVTNTSGLLTVDASALTAQASGTTTLKIDSTVHGTSGTASITGSAGEDVITVGNYASTVVGGGEDDSITGGTAADNIQGDAGNDTLAGGGGNDTITGGAGNDGITSGSGTKQNIDGGAGNDTVNMDSSLSTNDTVAGGDGTDILAIDTAGTATATQGVTGFEELRLDAAAINQNMVLFSTNTFSTITSNIASGSNNITNASTATTQLNALHTSDNLQLTRLLDSDSNSITFGAETDVATTVTTLQLDNEETITIDDGAIDSALALTITTLHAEDLVTLNITGGANVVITDAIENQSSQTLTTVDASAATGTVDVDVTNATLAVTMTGPSSKAATLEGGSGADTITTGSAADVVIGNGGADTINTGDGTDSITGGGGVDTLTGGEGADTIAGGAGEDSIILTETTSAIDLVQITSAVAISSESGRVTASGDDNDTGEDVVTGFKWGTDLIQITTTAVTGFVHGTDTHIGTATGDVNDGTTGSFLKTVGLIDDNTNAAFTDAGDIAISFASPSATVTETRFEAALVYNLTGANSADTITAGANDDTISGGGGADTIIGGSGADSIDGGAAIDSIGGGAGADTIDGEAGADIITGGTGDDTYEYDTKADSYVSTTNTAYAGIDVVTVVAGDIFDYTTAIAAVVASELSDTTLVDAKGSDLLTTLNIAFTGGDDGIANIEAAIIDYSAGEQFLVIDIDSDQGIDATDIVIALTGTVTGLSLSGGNAVIA